MRGSSHHTHTTYYALKCGACVAFSAHSQGATHSTSSSQSCVYQCRNNGHNPAAIYADGQVRDCSGHFLKERSVP